MFLSKKSSFLFSLFLFLFLSGFLYTGAVLAEETEEKKEVSYSCGEEGNAYLEKFDTAKNGKSFSEAFEEVKKDYHEKVNETFNEKVEYLSVSIFGEGKTENFEKACTPFQQASETLTAQLTQDLMIEFWEYECALSKIAETPQLLGTELTHSDGVNSLYTQESMILNEIENSYMALTQTIEMYSEMRIWYPVHRDLECLISQMQKYRNAVRGFVDRVSIMNAKYGNYASEKQQD